MTPEHLRHRQQRLRLPVTELAHLANTHVDNIRRMFSGKTDPRRSTMDKVASALTAEEARLLRYLKGEDAPEAAQ